MHTLADKTGEQLKLVSGLDSMDAMAVQEGSQEVQKKAYFSRIFENINKEIEAVVKVAKRTMRLPRNFHKRQIDELEEDRAWQTVQDVIQQQLTEEVKTMHEKEQDQVACLSRLLTLKDNLTKWLVQSLIYKKMVLWMDLDIRSDEYIRDTAV